MFGPFAFGPGVAALWRRCGGAAACPKWTPGTLFNGLLRLPVDPEIDSEATPQNLLEKHISPFYVGGLLGHFFPAIYAPF